MPTLIVRLAGPLQSWGTGLRFKDIDTHHAPTWSALLGLLRAALGHGRDANPGDIAWLKDLTMAVRVDAPGRVITDYHTVNPLPPVYLRYAKNLRGDDPMRTSDLAVVTTGAPLSRTGTTTPWIVNGQTTPLVTSRAYLNDAAFTWLIEADQDTLDRLAHALINPRWALSLGRKACPTGPLVLGTHHSDIEATARLVPVFTIDPTAQAGRPRPRWAQDLGAQDQAASDQAAPALRTMPLIWLRGTPTGPVTGQSVLRDNPVGSHPHDGYVLHAHQHATVQAPALRGPWHALLDWVTANPDLIRHPADDTAPSAL